MALIQIRVLKLSHLLVGICMFLFVAVLVAIAVSLLQGMATGQTKNGAAQAIVQADSEAEAVFATVSEQMQIEVLPPLESTEAAATEAATIAAESMFSAAGTHARILIYHTHTHEAYCQEAGDPYVETSAWRTADDTHNVVRVGEELAQILTFYGFEVVHDVTDHEPPKLATAYSRSLETITAYPEPFDLYIDIHRDSYTENADQVAYIMADGQEAAPMMLLVGNGEGFRQQPDYETNYRFAVRLTNELNSLAKGICRDVLVKDGRYNQHVGLSILVEVGHNRNTLGQALYSTAYLARAIKNVLAGA